MTQLAKTQEPSMEEILASIRRIIADDETKPAGTQAAAEPKVAPPKALTPTRAAPATPPAPVVQTAAAKPAAPPPAAPAAKNSQEDIDAMLAGLDADTSEAEIRAPEPASDVFELTEQMAIPEAPPAASPPPAPSFRQVDPQDDLEFSEPRPVARNYQTPAIDPPAFAADEAPSRPLLSSSTMTSVESAFNTLANTVLSNNARTLEDLVKEMLRPMLKSWLDDNLPNMVERIVRAEIERVSRGR